MNCQDFEKLALDLARNSLLDATARDQGLIHTEVCSRCAARLAEERALLARVRAVAAELAGEEPPARVDAALLAAFRAQTTATASSTVIPAFGGFRRWASWKSAAVAAGILILISALAIFWKSTNSRMPRREERAVAPAPVNTPDHRAAPPDGRDLMATEQPKTLPKRVRRRASEDSLDEVEVVTRFFPLREGEDLTTLDSLQVVRVELPSSALGEVGLPVDPETVTEPIKADVVLGQDGLARAIRFVR
ncbi:MAG TPA: hypothetical protein VJZ77_24475 [Blastocatellia bacterium]|nr:hypothetical protein [Blastocatellia bacterium]